MIRFLNVSAIAAMVAFATLPGSADAGALSGAAVIGNATVNGDSVSILTRKGINARRLSEGLGIDLSSLDVRHGSAIMQAFSVGDEGGSISFDWNFLTDELPGHGSSRNDFAFWSLMNQETGEFFELANAFESSFSESTSAFARETDFTTISRYDLSAGEYMLSFGVVNVGHNTNHSALLIENFAVNGGTLLDTSTNTIVNPEPASAAIWGLGILGVGVGAMRRRRRQSAAEVA